MKIKVGVSNRHVHLSKEKLEILFGKNYELTVKNQLSQKGRFASTSVVTIKGPKGEIPNVRVLGPTRDYDQVEISKTDAYKLGLNPPIRNSGDLEGSCPITIIGPNSIVNLEKGCIIATRHIHISTSELKRLGFNQNDKVFVKINGDKPAILGNIHFKVDDNDSLELHLDTDDANANLIMQGDEVEMIGELYEK